MSAVEPFNAPAVTGFLHTPEQSPAFGIVLTHGAGANCQSPLLIEVANGLASIKGLVLRCDLAFRQRRRFGPPHPSQAADDRNGLRAAVGELRKRCSGPVFLGGHSYGGRQATVLAAEDSALVDGLLLLSYPLHPPGKPQQLRTAHFPDMKTPALFVHGSNDPFGTIEELTAALRLIPAASDLLTVEGAGHDLKRGKAAVAPAMISRFAAVLLQPAK